MLVMLGCNSCYNLNHVDVIECSYCERYLIGEELEIHAEIEPGVVSPLALAVKHTPHLDEYEYANALSKAVEQHLDQNDYSSDAENNDDEGLLFKAMPSDTPDDVLINEAMPNISSMFGTSEMAEHLGIALREGHNGSINAHININARLMGGGFQMSETEARIAIENWQKDIPQRNFGDDADIGLSFITEVMTKIID